MFIVIKYFYEKVSIYLYDIMKNLTKIIRKLLGEKPPNKILERHNALKHTIPSGFKSSGHFRLNTLQFTLKTLRVSVCN